MRKPVVINEISILSLAILVITFTSVSLCCADDDVTSPLPCTSDRCQTVYDPQNDLYSIYKIEETKILHTTVTSDSSLGKYGYDFINIPDSSNKLCYVKVRGGVNKLSQDAHASLQLIMRW